MGLLLLRYGEIGLKGQNRAYFCRKLRQNVRQSLRANGIAGEVWQEGQRLYVETDGVGDAIDAVRRVFGVVSLSPVRVVPADMEAVAGEAASLAAQQGLNEQRSFRVEARRADKSFACTSPEIERIVGAAVVAATGARVDLSRRAGLEIGVEVPPGRALVFGQIMAGPGGLPLGTQGRLVALLSSGIDSPVAIWLMMKRGCSVIPVHFATSQAHTAQVRAIVEALNRYAYGWSLRPIVLSQEELLAPFLARLGELRAERWACLLCKHAMLSRASEIAEQMGASGLVTGDSMGQVASQTLSNLEAISYGISKPILRPLVGLDKTEIMALARSIGTYALSTEQEFPCPYLPEKPLTQSSLPRFTALLARLTEDSSTPIDQRGAQPALSVSSPFEGMATHA